MDCLENYSTQVNQLENHLRPLFEEYHSLLPNVDKLVFRVYPRYGLQQKEKVYIAVEFTAYISGKEIIGDRFYAPERLEEMLPEKLVYHHFRYLLNILKEWLEMPFDRIPLHLPLPHYRSSRKHPPFIHKLVRLRLREGF